MLNNMVNNWSTEIESFNINFVHISGKANVLADMLSRLIDTDPDSQQQPELEGHEFRKYCFETLPKVRGSTVCMLTGYTFCIPIKNKSAEEIATAWRNHIAFPFGVCRKLLTDNGTEFKNDLISRVAEQLGVERNIYSPPYRPQSNGRIEGFHKFFKSCLAKHISRHCEWDDVVPLATASYNWLPNQHSKESPFFVMYGRDAVTNLSQLTKPKLRYMGTEDLILDLELMSNIFQTQIHNLKKALE